jgi:hypothetical protein
MFTYFWLFLYSHFVYTFLVFFNFIYFSIATVFLVYYSSFAPFSSQNCSLTSFFSFIVSVMFTYMQSVITYLFKNLVFVRFDVYSCFSVSDCLKTGSISNEEICQKLFFFDVGDDSKKTSKQFGPKSGQSQNCLNFDCEQKVSNSFRQWWGPVLT